MEKAFFDFQKIRPYGDMGDGGNDGYRKDLGIYYQVYAPRVPKINEKDNFRSKPDGEEIVFYFNDSDYGVYNIQNKTFCRTKN
jgi:hypothetical protein